jgi:hypothetical protein
MAVPQKSRWSWLGTKSQDAIGGFVEADDDLGAADKQWAADQVGSLGHKFNGFGARRRLFGHTAFAEEIVAGVEEEFVITCADEFVDFGFGQLLFIEIAGVEVEFQFKQETSCFAAGGSSGFLVEDEFCWHIFPLEFEFGQLILS